MIATFATRARDAGLHVVVVASDKDLLQLVEGGVEASFGVWRRSSIGS